jgi:hypothetical protein
MQNPLVAKGCKCNKSRCIKGYCECFSAGRGCLAICGCQDCANVLGTRPPVHDTDFRSQETPRSCNQVLYQKFAKPPSPNGGSISGKASSSGRRPGRPRGRPSSKRALSISPAPDSSGSEEERAIPRRHNLDDLIAATEAVEASSSHAVPAAQHRNLLSGSWDHLLPDERELQFAPQGPHAPPPYVAECGAAGLSALYHQSSDNGAESYPKKLCGVLGSSAHAPGTMQELAS